ncbi:MAG: thiamine pyrophosphate-dependent enzyme, partial [Chitinispirillaceae bacterium]|nr:thiamine pyrophosphate-dependent enzyme [Chitinispirillaceae bacterium]
MYLSRVLDEKLKELFKKGYVKGTVILSKGNEATCIGMAIPFRPGYDVISLLHRDLPAHIAQSVSPLTILCQYLANEKSPTHAREGNVHHGNAAMRRFPMISHLGNMLAVAVGGVMGARRKGEDVMGLAVIGDGGSSTGDFHEAINIASVHHIPVLFLIENNHYAYSTPTRLQYNCQKLSDRAIGYGIEGKTIETPYSERFKTIKEIIDSLNNDHLRIVETTEGNIETVSYTH